MTPKTLNGVAPEDLVQILSRAESDEIKRLFDGYDSVAEHHRWDWERKYNIDVLMFDVYRGLSEATRLLMERLNPAGERSPRNEYSSTALLQKAIDCGVLPKNQLKDGSYYWGLCRNARVARWSEKKCLFFHQKKELGQWKVVSIPHPEDEEVIAIGGKVLRIDVFFPWIEVAPLDFERVNGDLWP